MQEKNQSDQAPMVNTLQGESPLAPVPQDAGELSETELDAVAGGGFDLFAWLKLPPSQRQPL